MARYLHHPTNRDESATSASKGKNCAIRSAFSALRKNIRVKWRELLPEGDLPPIRPDASCAGQLGQNCDITRDGRDIYWITMIFPGLQGHEVAGVDASGRLAGGVPAHPD
jgi:hypothetical protein